MACLTAAQRTAIEAEITKLNTLIDAYCAALLEAATGSRIKEYRFDSGDGSQKAEYLNPNELNKLIESLTARRNRLQGKLSRTGIVSVNVRRRPRC